MNENVPFNVLRAVFVVFPVAVFTTANEANSTGLLVDPSVIFPLMIPGFPVWAKRQLIKDNRKIKILNDFIIIT